MPSAFPAALDSFTNPAPADLMNTFGHAAHHAALADAIVAIQQRVGIDGSNDVASLENRLSNIPAGPQGPPGADGAQGPQGIQGVPGTPADISAAWPVNSIFISIVATNPATLLGFGTWVPYATGQMLVGFDAGQTEFDTIEKVGGEKTHVLSVDEMPTHTHVQDAHGHSVTDPGHTHLTQRYPTTTGGSSGFTADTSMSGTLADNTLPVKNAATGVSVNNATAVNQQTGGGGAHNNLPPYIVVRFWLRTA